MNHVLIQAFTIALLALTAASCAAPAANRITPLEGAPGGLKIGDIIETSSGRTISVDTLLDQLSQIRIVYAGETHSSMEDHFVQLEILKGLQARGRTVVLAMEMFPREVQPVLDRYSAGKLTEEEFRREVDWEKVWGFPYELYRGILSFAGDKRLRIVGLNAPRDVVAKIAKTGLSSLSPEQRSRIAQDFHMDDMKHKEHIREAYNQHLKESIKGFEEFYEAQMTWEETMSETLAKLESGLSEQEEVLVLLGKGHMSDREGVPALTAGRTAASYKTVAPVPIDYPGSVSDPNLADYVWITDKTEPVHPFRLGVMIHPAKGGAGVEILAVAPGSPAEEAGLKKGDVITAFDSKPIKSIDEFHAAIARGEREHLLTVKRGGKTIVVTVSFAR